MNPTTISKIAKQESWRKELNRPVYHIQKWWATRLGTVFRSIIIDSLSTNANNPFYQKYNFQNKIVYDPFMGSGTTLGEGLKVGARVIGSDINPISFFGVKQALTNVSTLELVNEFNKLQSKLRSNIVKLHSDKNGNPVLYYLWVHIAKIEGIEVPLFKTYIFSKNAYPKRHPEAKAICPKCWTIINCKYNSTTVTCPNCNYTYNPQRGPVRGAYVYINNKKYKLTEINDKNQLFKEKMFAKIIIDVDDKKHYTEIDDFDRDLYKSTIILLKKNTHLPLPSQKIRDGINTKQILNYNYKYWSDLFNSRQLYSLGILLKEISKIENNTIKEQFLTLFTGVLEYNNRFNTYKGEGTGAVRSIFNNHILKSEHVYVENSVWSTVRSSGTFNSLFTSRLLPAKEYLNKPFEVVPKSLQKEIGKKSYCNNPIKTNISFDWNTFNKEKANVLLLNKDSSNVPIPDNFVDAVITDPPYFDYINYSELSDFFYAWLSPMLKQKYNTFTPTNSSNNKEVQNNNVSKFTYALSNVFTESSRILKENGSLIFSFHYSKPEGWAAIYNAIKMANLEIYDIYPIIDDFSSATIKFQTSSPINIDIFFCTCKRNKKSNERGFNKTLKDFINIYEKADISLSKGDKYAIDSALTMLSESKKPISEQDPLKKLKAVFDKYN